MSSRIQSFDIQTGKNQGKIKRIKKESETSFE